LFFFFSGLFEVSRDADVGVALYTRRVLIKSKAENILPKWLRFVKGKCLFPILLIFGELFHRVHI